MLCAFRAQFFGNFFMLIVVVYILLGMIAGTLSGLFGIGGGLIVVPVLSYLYKIQGFNPAINMHMAVGTSLAIIIITSIRSLFSHMKHKIEFWSLYRQLFIGVILGTIGGVVLAHYLHSNVIKIIFGVFVLLMSIRMIFFKKTNPKRHLPNKPIMNGAGFIIGAKSGLLGLGGGALTIPFLTYCNVGMRRAVIVSVATSLTVGFVGSLTGILVSFDLPNLPKYSTGYIYWPACLCVAIGSVLFAPVGTMLSHRLPVAILKRFFGIFLVFVGVHMLWPGGIV